MTFNYQAIKYQYPKLATFANINAAFEHVCRTGDMELVRVLAPGYNFPKVFRYSYYGNENVYISACRNNNFHVADYLLQLNPDYEKTNVTLVNYVYNSIQQTTWLWPKLTTNLQISIISLIIEKGSVEILKSIVEKTPQISNTLPTSSNSSQTSNNTPQILDSVQQILDKAITNSFAKLFETNRSPIVMSRYILQIRPSMTKFNNSTILYHACSKNDMILAKYIIDTWPIFVNKRTDDDCLIVSCRNNSIDMAQWLIDTFINVDYSDAAKQAFTVVCQNDALDIAQWLVATLDTVDYSDAAEEAFEIACDNDNFDVVQWLVHYFTQVDFSDVATIKFVSVCTDDRKELAKWLVKNVNGTDIEYKNHRAFKHAIYANSMRVARWLIKNYDAIVDDLDPVRLLCKICQSAHSVDDACRLVEQYWPYADHSGDNWACIGEACQIDNVDTLTTLLDLFPSAQTDPDSVNDWLLASIHHDSYNTLDWLMENIDFDFRYDNFAVFRRVCDRNNEIAIKALIDKTSIDGDLADATTLLDIIYENSLDYAIDVIRAFDIGENMIEVDAKYQEVFDELVGEYNSDFSGKKSASKS